jgi:hypothetical protein
VKTSGKVPGKPDDITASFAPSKKNPLSSPYHVFSSANN